jgi:hypothetical protein
LEHYTFLKAKNQTVADLETALIASKRRNPAWREVFRSDKGQQGPDNSYVPVRFWVVQSALDSF